MDLERLLNIISTQVSFGAGLANLELSSLPNKLLCSEINHVENNHSKLILIHWFDLLTLASSSNFALGSVFGLLTTEPWESKNRPTEYSKWDNEGPGQIGYFSEKQLS